MIKKEIKQLFTSKGYLFQNFINNQLLLIKDIIEGKYKDDKDIVNLENGIFLNNKIISEIIFPTSIIAQKNREYFSARFIKVQNEK